MALIKQNLVRILNGGCAVGGDVKSIYHLATNDADTVVEAVNYFNSRVGDLKVGDLILGSLDLDGVPEIKTYIVATNDGTVVTVTAMNIV